MIDKDIIKALECCLDMQCTQCPFNYEDCEERDFESLVKRAIPIFNHLQAENEGLLQKLQQAQAKYETFKAQEEKANQYCKNVCEPKYKAEIEKLQEKNKILDLNRRMAWKEKEVVYEMMKTAKAEAVKEFAERLKAVSHPYANTQMVFELQIDNLVKEMVGEG